MLLLRKEGLPSMVSLSILACLSTLPAVVEKLHSYVTESFCSPCATCLLVQAKAPLF